MVPVPLTPLFHLYSYNPWIFTQVNRSEPHKDMCYTSAMFRAKASNCSNVSSLGRSTDGGPWRVFEKHCKTSRKLYLLCHMMKNLNVVIGFRWQHESFSSYMD